MARCELGAALRLYARRAGAAGSVAPAADGSPSRDDDAAALHGAPSPDEHATRQLPRPLAAGLREFRAELCVACGNKLGECPLWDEGRQLLCWIDIQGNRFWRHDPSGPEGNAESFELPARPGSFCIAQGGEYVFAFEDGFSFYDPIKGRRDRITKDFEPSLRTRLNDGRVDRQGRFVAAGCVEKGGEPATAIYRLNADLSVEQLRGGVQCGNSICFSRDGGMFFADPGFVLEDGEEEPQAAASTIWHFPDYAASGLHGARPFAAAPGRPDGSVLDAEGCLWNAEFGGGRVVRYRPDGVADMVVSVPARYTTCAAFGGPDLRTLYVTDASVFANQRLSRKHREELPEGYAGGLFRCRLPVAGLPEPLFRGSL